MGEGLASCVQIQPGATSFYRWEGKVNRDDETLLIIKAPAKKVDALRARFLELHPYEVPEFLPLRVDENLANPSYLDWLQNT